MRDLVVDLRRLVRQPSIPDRTSRRARWVAAAAAVVLLTAAVTTVFQLRQPVVPMTAEYVQLTNLDSATQPALSPDGRMMAFVRGPNTFMGEGQIYVKLLPDGEFVYLSFWANGILAVPLPANQILPPLPPAGIRSNRGRVCPAGGAAVSCRERVPRTGPHGLRVLENVRAAEHLPRPGAVTSRSRRCHESCGSDARSKSGTFTTKARDVRCGARVVIRPSPGLKSSSPPVGGCRTASRGGIDPMPHS
jgi:hypothetical protein